MNEVLILNEEEISSLLSLPMAISAVERAYCEKNKGTGSIWPMVFHDFAPKAADLDIKSGDIGGLGCYGLKVVSWFGDNTERGLPALIGTSLIFDAATGAPKALLNAGSITHFRTGAAGALGAKYLARPDSKTLLMAGAGGLAPYLIASALYLMPQLERVWLINPHRPGRTEKAYPAVCAKVDALLAACGAERRAEISIPAGLEQAARQSDIIFTATPAREAYLKAEWVKPGTHLSCVGADMSGKQEVESALFKKAKAFGDDTAQCLAVGECELAYKAGALTALAGEIGEVITESVQGRCSAEEITVFDSTGIALQDIACAAALIDYAAEQGVGKTVLV